MLAFVTNGKSKKYFSVYYFKGFATQWSFLSNHNTVHTYPASYLYADSTEAVHNGSTVTFTVQTKLLQQSLPNVQFRLTQSWS